MNIFSGMKNIIMYYMLLIVKNQWCIEQNMGMPCLDYVLPHTFLQKELKTKNDRFSNSGNNIVPQRP